ncbi:hypothetical protein HRR83_000107 [Exophiala dermatitidis]|uniref:Uncharacterized protein n=2 Tax=Exophiala dermatitidis TaxID=5970 RepID=H6C8B9_EXODN|nr:uncharacterized protein HMPREF1120_08312 [Exophiala dermatitidis NIH/UT8656]KAJ4523460.1 hypothetical protein HRR73_002641 [Exophiala dermatitidis]EHY60346.1 hypothetical protein HMPREF1120_08312 [Exophiala dermatitidis NIH/UT8656]KAJ4524507.1 hypothetical protein HRR75_000095 [Exophiala dermatitidis]KAJ4527356.1 hypothetical protein HRR74_000108 [Exophiala dermatitidis]KAJ4530913.1 hypothetical protein HRR76_008603 [Exophiala dermatitidis]
MASRSRTTAAVTTTTFSICQQCLRTGALALGRTPGGIRGFASAVDRRAPASRTARTRVSRTQTTPSVQIRASFFSTSSRLRAAAKDDTGKPIVLEQPDKFRPPSHPSRLNARRVPRAYNQAATTEEKQQQKTRRYPHMFPNEGTFMHWFLTDRKIHIWITMGTLTILAIITMTETFVKTSPYGHLLPPISSLFFHPITYFREALAVVRLHIEYTTEQANESRQQKILDAQKRRLYRRAHGMENLDAEEEQGIDVRGLVPWDDGLTNKERARGGRDVVLTGKDVVDMGGKVGEDVTKFADKVKQQQQQQQLVTAGAGADVGADVDEPAPAPQQPQRKRKLWLGIW